MAWPFKPRSSLTVREGTGSKWTGRCAKRRARRRATSSGWKSRRWPRSRNPGCRPLCGRLSRRPSRERGRCGRTSRPSARRDWIHWIVSARQAETRRASDPNDLRHARQRQATPVLLRSLGDVCQEPQLPRSRRLVEVTRGAREEFCLRASQRKVGRFLRSWLSGVARGRQPGSEHGVDSA